MCRRSELAVLERVDLQVEVNGFLTVVFRLSNSDQEGKVLSHPAGCAVVARGTKMIP